MISNSRSRSQPERLKQSSKANRDKAAFGGKQGKAALALERTDKRTESEENATTKNKL